MASSYSPLLRLELIGSGEQAGLWGETTNKNLGTLIEQAIAGVSTISLSGGAGTVVLSTLNGTQDQARSAVLKFIGNPSGTKTIEIPAVEKLYVARNDSGQTIIFKTPAQVIDPLLGGVEVLDGESTLVFCDGAVAVAGIQTASVGTLTVPGGGTGVTSFTGGFVKSPGGTGALTSTTSVSLTSDVTGTLPAGFGGTGRNTMTSGRLLVGDGSNPVGLLGGTSAGQIATWDGASWVAQTPATGGVSSFNGRVGAVSPQSGDYSAFYPGTTGSGASGTWNISINGNAATATSASTANTANSANTADSATTATTASNANALGGTAPSGYVNTSASQTITGSKAFSAVLYTAGGINFGALANASGNSIYLFSGNIDFSVGSVVRARVFNNGNFQIFGATASKPGGGTWSDSSDARLKNNVQPLQGALSKITALNPVAYQWNYDNPNSPDAGFIAQEVELVFPDAISESEPTDAQKPFIPDGEKVLNIGWKNDMTAYLVGAIKELKAELDSVKAELAALK